MSVKDFQNFEKNIFWPKAILTKCFYDLKNIKIHKSPIHPPPPPNNAVHTWQHNKKFRKIPTW